MRALIVTIIYRSLHVHIAIHTPVLLEPRRRTPIAPCELCMEASDFKMPERPSVVDNKSIRFVNPPPSMKAVPGHELFMHQCEAQALETLQGSIEYGIGKRPQQLYRSVMIKSMEMAVKQHKLSLWTLRHIITACNMDPDALLKEEDGVSVTVNATFLGDSDLIRFYRAVHSTPIPKYHNCNWVQCDRCSKWRRIFCTVIADEDGEWTCAMVPNGTTTCETPEDGMEVDELCGEAGLA